MKRRNPNLTDQLCALIVAHFGIPREYAKNMTRREIKAIVVWDHDPVPFSIADDLGWAPAEYNHPSNLSARLAEDHAVKTAKIDIPAIAKANRITDAHAEFQRRVLAKAGQAQESGTDRPKHRWPRRKMVSRPFPKRRHAS